MKAKTVITIVFLSLLILVFFGKFLPGCASGCKAKIKGEDRKEKKEGKKGNTEKTKGEEEQDSTDEQTSGPGIIEQIFGREKVTVEQTFWVVTYSDQEMTKVVESIHCVTPWKDTISTKLWFNIIPDSGQVVQIIPPAWYENNTTSHQSPTVIYHGNFKGKNIVNPQIGPRGDGPFIIQSPIMQ